MQRQTKKKRNLEKGDWKLDPKTDWIVRGCSGEEGEPRWKLLELKLKKTKGLERRLLFCGRCSPEERRRLCVWIMDDVVVDHIAESSSRCGRCAGVLGK